MSIRIDEREHRVFFSGGTEIVSHDDFKAYWEVMQGAFAVHLDREAIRQALWKQYPAKAQADQIKIKIERVLNTLERLERPTTPTPTGVEEKLVANVVDELLDVINYANFAIRQLQP